VDVVTEVVHDHMPPGSVEQQWDIPGLERTLEAEFQCRIPVQQWLSSDSQLHIDGVVDRVTELMAEYYSRKERELLERGFDANEMRKVERHIMLQVLDRHWKDHLASMDQLRQGIHLRGYAQKNPKQEYKREAFELFQHMMNQIQHQLIRVLHTLEMRRNDELEQMERQRAEEAKRLAESMRAVTPPLAGDSNAAPAQGLAGAQPVVREFPKVGRNEPCPCGSGKKYKHCHGKLDV